MTELLKAVMKTGTGSVLSMSLGMAAMKVLAVVLGPGGVGLFTLLRQTYQTAVTVSVLNGQMAVVQGVSSREESARPEFLATILWIMAGMGLAVSFLLVAFAPYLSRAVLGQSDPESVQMVRWLSLAVLLGVAQTYLTCLMNGYRAVGRVAVVQIASFGTLALLALPAARLAKSGGVAAFSWLLIASAAAAAGIALLLEWRSGRLAAIWGTARFRFSRPAARAYFPMAFTFLVTGCVGTLVPLGVRAIAAREFGLQAAGILDVAWTVSMAYISLLLSSFSTYYLPTLSGMTDSAGRCEIILRVLRLALHLMLPLVTAVIVLKPLIARLLYSSEFLPALPIMRWMLIGDYFKVASWIFSFTIIASADMRTFLWTEILCGSVSLAGAVLAILKFRWLPGIGVTYMLLYLGYLLYTFSYVRRRHQFSPGSGIIFQWLAGLILVVAASIQTWNQTQVHWIGAALWIGAASALSLAFLDRKGYDTATAWLGRWRSPRAKGGPASG